MNVEPDTLISWLTTLTPDKLAIVFPFMVGYAIVRAKHIDNRWNWIICPTLASFLFLILSPNDLNRTAFQDMVFKMTTGATLGIISTTMALGLHSMAFKWLANRFPMMKFLVLSEEPESQSKPGDKPPSV